MSAEGDLKTNEREREKKTQNSKSRGHGSKQVGSSDDKIKFDRMKKEMRRPHEAYCRETGNGNESPKTPSEKLHSTGQLLRIAVANAAAVRENAALGHQLEHVRQRQKANVDIIGSDARQHGLRGAAACGHQVLVRNDDALGHAGGARGVPVVAGKERWQREWREKSAQIRE